MALFSRTLFIDGAVFPCDHGCGHNFAMKTKKGLSQQKYRENHISQMRKKIGEEIDHNLDLRSGGPIIQVMANDLSLSEETKQVLKWRSR